MQKIIGKNFYRLCSLIACLLWLFGAFGQSPQKNLKYRGLVQGGPVFGSYGLSYQVQTVQGVGKNRWFTGVVGGYDDYRMPGLLLGLHGSYTFGHKKLLPHLLAQAGPFVPVRKGFWAAKAWDNENWMIDLKTGWFAQGGAGVSMPLGKKGQRLHLNALYSIKKGVYSENSWFWGPVPGPGPWMPMVPADVKQRLNMNRLVIQAGISW
ncbi:MAG: hypothetical protein MUF24_03305 [Chitinophagaceae bacterium]|jgi:hypothetical protein|nr:hypothetical protein [Chitinophagaceae bacterium]